MRKDKIKRIFVVLQGENFLNIFDLKSFKAERKLSENEFKFKQRLKIPPIIKIKGECDLFIFYSGWRRIIFNLMIKIIGLKK